jgi:hypothetical protein
MIFMKVNSIRDVVHVSKTSAHVAQLIYILQRGNAAKMPATKRFLQRIGVWDRAEHMDAAAQWLWLVEIFCKFYLKMREMKANAEALAAARWSGVSLFVYMMWCAERIMQTDLRRSPKRVTPNARLPARAPTRMFAIKRRVAAENVCTYVRSYALVPEARKPSGRRDAHCRP